MTRTRKVVLNASALVGALLAVAGWALRSSARVLDERYVHVDSFAAYQAGVAQQHQRDSLIQDARSTRQEQMLGELYRACQRRGECP